MKWDGEAKGPPPALALHPGAPYNGAMNVIRLALILLAGWIIWRLLSARLEQGRRNRELKRQQKEHQRLRPEAMVQCAHCGLHVPEKQAFRANGRTYCSAEHRDADTA